MEVRKTIPAQDMLEDKNHTQQQSEEQKWAQAPVMGRS